MLIERLRKEIKQNARKRRKKSCEKNILCAEKAVESAEIKRKKSFFILFITVMNNCSKNIINC